LIQVGIGLIGLTPREFWRLSVKDFRLIQRGFFEKQKSEMQVQYEVGRLISYHAIAPYMKGKKSIQQFMPFEWEKKTANVELTKEQQDYIEMKLGRFVDENGNYYN